MNTNIMVAIQEATRQMNLDSYDHGEVLTVNSDNPSFRRVDLTRPYRVDSGTAIANYVDPADGHRKTLIAQPGHSLVIGSTGSGKTQCFYMPQIEILAHAEDAPSMLVMDLKGEIYRQKSQMLRDQGYNVIVLNGKQPYYSTKYNPMAIIWDSFHKSESAKALLKNCSAPFEFQSVKYTRKSAYVRAVSCYANEQFDYCNAAIAGLTSTLIPIDSRDPSWDYGARDIATGIIWAMLSDSMDERYGMTKDKFTLYNLANFVSQREDDCDTIIDYIKLHGESSAAYRLMNYYSSSARVTRDSFIMVLANHLNKTVNNSTNVLGAVSEMDINLIVNDLGKARTAIFLIADTTNKSTYTFCTLFLMQLMNELARRGDSCSTGDFHVLWDEFANGVVLEDVVDWITTMRSRRVWLHLGIQSLQQLDAKFNAAQRCTILGNTRFIFLGSNDKFTLKELSESCGSTIAAIATYNVANNGAVSASTSPTSVPLVHMSDLAHIQLGNAYVKLFGNYGNQVLFAQLDPNFLVPEYSHSEVQLQCETQYSDVDVSMTYYSISSVVAKLQPKRKGSWDC